jgi:DNA-binding LacI/PurR family transcriptional regulator
MMFEKVDFNSPKPLYIQIEDSIREKITNMQIAKGDNLPSLDELSKMFGVGIRTTRIAVSGLVKEGYLLSRQKYGTMVLDSEPKKYIDLKKQNEIGVILGIEYNKGDPRYELENSPRHHTILNKIEEKLKEKELYMVYSTATGNIDPAMIKKDMAVLILSGAITPKIYKTVQKTGIPFIMIGDLITEKETGVSVDVIADDDFQGGYIAAKHLIEFGHKRIAFISVELKYKWDMNELNGYKKALEEAGIDFDRSLVIELENDYKYSVEGACQAMRGFLEKSIPFTALLNNGGEILCYGAMKAIREKGIRIPEDVSVVCKGMSFELTLVHHNFEESARIAVERLIERIENPGLKPERIVVPPMLVVRDSVRKI